MGKLKCQQEERKEGGLGDLDMVYRWPFSMIIKPLVRNGFTESFRTFYIIHSSF